MTDMRTTPDPLESDAVDADHPSMSDTDTQLRALRSEVRAQGARITATSRGFSIFAVLGFVIAMVTLLAVVSKLDKKTTTVTVNRSAPVAAVAKAPAAATPAALPRSVDVSMTEFAFKLSTPTAGSGLVAFHIKNDGKAPHEFVVLKTAKGAGTLMKGSRADETGNLGESGDMAAGASKTIHVKLQPGHYALICNLPGHYKAGMWKDFTVKG